MRWISALKDNPTISKEDDGYRFPVAGKEWLGPYTDEELDLDIRYV